MEGISDLCVSTKFAKMPRLDTWGSSSNSVLTEVSELSKFLYILFIYYFKQTYIKYAGSVARLKITK